MKSVFIHLEEEQTKRPFLDDVSVSKENHEITAETIYSIHSNSRIIVVSYLSETFLIA